MLRDPLLPFANQWFRAGSGHDYHRFHAFPLLRSNAAILRLPFELWPLADIVTNIIITGEADDVDSEV